LISALNNFSVLKKLAGRCYSVIVTYFPGTMILQRRMLTNII